MQLDKIENPLGSDITQNVTLGNRNNLLFVEACLEQIEQKKTKMVSDNTHQIIEMYWSAILGLQSG
jgi:hypothetical protein